MSKRLTTPWDVAEAFLTKFDMYHSSGTLDGPVLDYEISRNIMNSIKVDPYGMINFFVQTNYLIKYGLDEKYGKNAETSIQGFMEWANLTYSMFIPVLSATFNQNDILVNTADPKLVPDEYKMGVPDINPSEVFKNIEGFSMEWITPDVEDSDDSSQKD